jgi:hypothetical protein
VCDFKLYPGMMFERLSGQALAITLSNYGKTLFTGTDDKVSRIWEG